MDNLDYISENALKRYPFKDDATLLWTSGGFTGELPNAALLDALVVSDDPAAAPRLTSLVYRYSSNPGQDSWTMVFEIRPGFSASVQFDASDADASNYQVIPGYLTGSGLQIRMEASLIGLQSLRDFAFTQTTGSSTTGYSGNFGDYVLGIGSSLSYFTGSQIIYFDFDSSCRLCQSAVRHVGPLVKQLAFQEINQSGSIATVATLTSAINIDPGTNLQFTGTDKLMLNVIAGAGQGLFNACTLLDQVIRTINNIAADAYGNSVITTDACYQLVRGAHGIEISNVCKPQCTNDELAAFAHYLNRMKSGEAQLAEYVKVLKANYDALVARYAELNANKAKIRPTYIKTVHSRTTNYKKDYFSITASLYSPNPANNTSMPVSMTVVVGSKYAVEPGSVYTTSNGNTILQTDPGIDTVSATCNSQLSQRMVVTAVKPGGVSQVNNGDPGFDVVYKASTPYSHAYYSLPLLYDAPNISISCTVITDGGVKLIDFSCAFLMGAPAVVDSSLLIEFPASFTLGSSTLTTNNVPVTLGSRFGFASRSIDYRKSVVYHATLSCPVSVGGTFTIPVILDTTYGVSGKLMLLTL